MNVIFLDIDGVLCHHRVSGAYGERGLMRTLDPIGLAMIRRLKEMFRANVVISSTWRMEGYDFVRTAFCAAGYPDLIGMSMTDWCTEQLSGIRGLEIERYVLDHEVDNYLIIDDDSDFFEYQKLFHIHTDEYDGILWRHFVQARDLISEMSNEEVEDA